MSSEATAAVAKRLADALSDGVRPIAIPPRRAGDIDLDLDESRLLRLDYQDASLTVFHKPTGKTLLHLSTVGLTVLYELLRTWPRFPATQTDVAACLARCGEQRLLDRQQPYNEQPPVREEPAAEPVAATLDYPETPLPEERPKPPATRIAKRRVKK